MASDEQAKREKDRQFREEALRWLPEVTRYALSLTRNEADADDLIQETFLQAYRSWDKYAPGTEARGWLFRICRNLFLRTRQREQRQVACDDPELEALAAAAVHASGAARRARRSLRADRPFGGGGARARRAARGVSRGGDPR